MAAFRAALLAWYDAEGRTLPWRVRPDDANRPDPYRVWLSEVMLQQTTVAHGTRYWHAFVEAFPTVCDLARAPSEEVMGMWAGLGYYARARNLHACAKRVCGAFGGVFPTDETTLLSLPGIGPYTAAAIAAICEGAATNVVDGNVERVVARLFAVEEALPRARGELKRLAGTLVREGRAGCYPQALMDLGATVCRPKSPLCMLCPVRAFCAAHALGEMERFPVRARKARVPTRHGLAFVSRREGEVWLERRPDAGLLGGTLGFPTTAWVEAVERPKDDVPGDWERVGGIVHVFSHFRLELGVCIGGPPRGAGAWYAEAECARLPSVMRKVWERVRNCESESD